MRTFFAFSFLFFSTTYIYAQGGFNGRGYGNISQSYVQRNYDGLEVTTKGSRFFNSDDYVKGELKSPDSLYQNDFLYRYDQMAKTLQIKFSDGKDMLLDPRDIVHFKLFIEDKTFLFERTLVPYKKEHDILQVLYSSPTMRLLRDTKKKKTRITEMDPYTSAPSTRYDVYENDYRYYLIFDDMTRFHSVQISKSFFAN